MTNKSSVDYWADWLVDAVATETQDRRFLQGDPEADAIAIEAIRANSKKAMENLIHHKGARDGRDGKMTETITLPGEWGLRRLSEPVMCDSCGKHPADLPSCLCPGCEAYQQHQQ